MKILVLTVSVFAVFAALADRQPFERYQSIIDRQMFGPLPRGFDPSKLPSEAAKGSDSEKQLTQEEEKLKSSIHFSMINVTPDGATAVGFTDNSDPKVPVHYYLKVGETSNGWTVREADAVAATMTIAKDEIEVSLSLGANSAKGAGTTSRAGAVPAATGASASGIRRPSLFGGSGVGGGFSRLGNGIGGNLNLRERRNLRLQEKAKLEAEEKQKADEEKARQAEREAVAEAEKAVREKEREEQRRQLQEIQEELKRTREASEKLKAEVEESSDASDES